MSEDILARLTAPDWRGPMQHCRSWSDLDRMLDDAAAEITRLRSEATLIMDIALLQAEEIKAQNAETSRLTALVGDAAAEIVRLTRLTAPVTDEGMVEAAALRARAAGGEGADPG